MALALLILVPIFLGVIRFGVACFYFSELQNAVRTGARYGSYRTYNSASPTPTADWTAAVRNVTVFGAPGGGTRPVVPGLTPQNVSVEMTFTRAVPDQVRVRIQNYDVNLWVTTVRLQKPFAEYPYVGRYAPPD
jgi:hypothetical protein